MSGLGGFKKLGPKSAADLLTVVFSKKIPILFKFNDSTVFRAKPAAEKNGVSMIVSRPPNVSEERHGQEVTGQFAVMTQVYFFRAKIRIREESVSLQLVDGVHQLIRRRDDRYPIPSNMAMEMITKRVGDQIVFVRGALIDLSLRGCAVGFGSPVKFKPGETIQATLRFENRKPITFQGIIRHQVPPKRTRFEKAYGIEIHECDNPIRLKEWILVLQRKTFEFTRS